MTERLTIDTSKRCYLACGPRGGSKERLSWDYVWYMSHAMSDWLAVRTRRAPRMQRGDARLHGSVQGWELFVALREALRYHFQLHGEAMDLRNSALTGREGQHLTVCWGGERYTSGELVIAGVFMRFHMLVRPGNKAGRKAWPWMVPESITRIA